MSALVGEGVFGNPDLAEGGYELVGNVFLMCSFEGEWPQDTW